MPEPLTLVPVIIILAIVSLLAFWLFAPYKWVAAQLNWMGGIVQKVVAWIVKLFSKKSVAPTPITPGPIEPGVPVGPTKIETSEPTETK